MATNDSTARKCQLCSFDISEYAPELLLCAICAEDGDDTPQVRLEYLRGELRAERISQGELIELQGLAEHITDGDVELLEAAGVPEYGPGSRRDALALLPEATAPEQGDEHAGHVEIDGEWFTPAEIREYAATLVGLADFATEQA